MRWTARERRAIVAGAAVAALVVLYVAVAEPLAHWSQSVGVRLEMTEARLRTAQLKAAQRQGMERRVEALREELGLGPQVRWDQGHGRFIEALERQARDCGVEIKSLGTLRDREGAADGQGQWKGLAVKAECDLPALTSLLFWLQCRAGMTVTDKVIIDLQGRKPGRLAVDLDLRTYTPGGEAPEPTPPRRDN